MNRNSTNELNKENLVLDREFENNDADYELYYVNFYQILVYKKITMSSS